MLWLCRDKYDPHNKLQLFTGTIPPMLDPETQTFASRDLGDDDERGPDSPIDSCFSEVVEVQDAPGIILQPGEVVQVVLAKPVVRPSVGQCDAFIE